MWSISSALSAGPTFSAGADSIGGRSSMVTPAATNVVSEFSVARYRDCLPAPFRRQKWFATRMRRQHLHVSALALNRATRPGHHGAFYCGVCAPPSDRGPVNPDSCLPAQLARCLLRS